VVDKLNSISGTGRSTANKWAVLAVLVTIPFMVTLDGTIVNVALPVMVKDLHTTMESIQTVVTSYLIAVVAFILLFGRMGDAKGKGRIFIFGVAAFTAGSVMAGLSHNLAMLNVARVIEGIGGGAAMANNQGIITETFPASERGRALGISGVFSAVGTMCGPPVGGLIVSNMSWNYIFLINIPVGIIGLIAALKLLPRGEKKPDKIDIPGAALLAVAVILFFYGLLTGQKHGYLRPEILLAFAGSIVFLVLFLRAEKKNPEPILDLSLFKNPIFTLSIICVLIQFTISGGISIMQPFFMEDVLRLSAEQTGLVMMSLPIAMGITSPISGYLSDKFGPGKLTLIGLLLMSAGIVLLGTMTATISTSTLILYLCIIGVGGGIFSAPNTSMIMSTAPKDKLGIVGSTNGFVRNFGSVLGVSVFTTILYSIMSTSLGYQVTGYVSGKPDVFVSAMHGVYYIATAFTVIGVILTIIRLRKDKAASENQKPEGGQQ